MYAGTDTFFLSSCGLRFSGHPDKVSFLRFFTPHQSLPQALLAEEEEKAAFVSGSRDRFLNVWSAGSGRKAVAVLAAEHNPVRLDALLGAEVLVVCCPGCLRSFSLSLSL